MVDGPRRSAASHGDTRGNGRRGHLRRESGAFVKQRRPALAAGPKLLWPTRAFGKSLEFWRLPSSAPQSVARHSPSAAFRRWWSGLVRLLASGSRSIHTCGEVWDFFWSSRPSLASNSWRSHTCRGRGTKARDRVEGRRLAARARYPAPAVGLPPSYRFATIENAP